MTKTAVQWALANWTVQERAFVLDALEFPNRAMAPMLGMALA